VPTLGLCYFPPKTSGYGNYLYRATCTDKSWLAKTCSSVCITESPNRYETVSFCNATMDFCCPKSVEGNCCDHPNLRFSLDVPQDIMSNLINAPTEGPPSSNGSVTPVSSVNTTKKASISPGAAAGAGFGGIVGLLLVGYLMWALWKKYWRYAGNGRHLWRRPRIEDHLKKGIIGRRASDREALRDGEAEVGLGSGLTRDSSKQNSQQSEKVSDGTENAAEKGSGSKAVIKNMSDSKEDVREGNRNDNVAEVSAEGEIYETSAEKQIQEKYGESVKGFK